MKITKEIVRKTAHLARLHFDETKEAEMVHDLQKMVDWVDKLKEGGHRKCRTSNRHVLRNRPIQRRFR